MKLTYFQVYGKAEAIRILFDHAKVDYEDNRVTGDVWKEFKASDKCPIGQVPVLEKDGKILTQSNAILRYVGSEYGYYPEDAELRYRADELVDLTDDFKGPVGKNHFGSASPEEKSEEWKGLLENHYTKFFTFFEGKLKENSSQDFIVGDTYTIADFSLLAAYGSVINHPLRKEDTFKVLDNYPVLKEYFALRWAAQKDYFDNRDECSI
mmetsp:Transcript_20739/g.23096  ORF Transcript_20739/g.23096 Transcript_20739/m.23096 type:complete len:209 (-) Transcript_20739:38-664(-)